MAKRFLNGIVTGAGFVAVVAVAFAIAWAGDVFTIDKDGTSKFVVSDQGKITVGATESYVNLVIQNDEVAAEADNKLDITADVLTVEGIRLENLNVSANIESAGAGGLDTGSEAANTWYYVWVVTNNVGTSVNGLLSTSSTAPTLPAGFTKKRRVGAVRNQGNPGNFLGFIQQGNFVTYPDHWMSNYILSVGQATVWTSVSASTLIPTTSHRGYFMLAIDGTHNAAGVVLDVHIRAAGSLTGGGEHALACRSQVANVATRYSSPGVCTVDPAQNIEYRMNSAPNVSGGGYITVAGYYDRI